MMIDLLILCATSKTVKNLTLSIIPSYKMLDGRYSNTSQESPDPISKLTWDAFYIGHNFAKEYSLITGDGIRLYRKRCSKGTGCYLPGQHDHTLNVLWLWNNSLPLFHYGLQQNA